jgi:hypothetical protein
MKLIKMIPLHLVKTSLEAIRMEFPQFVLVQSQGFLKIYKQVVV